MTGVQTCALPIFGRRHVAPLVASTAGAVLVKVSLPALKVVSPVACNEAAAVVLAFYFDFTVVLWGTIYYHLRIGTRWTNGIRFIRLVCENPDPTSGNFLEQAPKVLMLVFAVLYVTGDPGAGSVSLVLGFSGAVAGQETRQIRDRDLAFEGDPATARGVRARARRWLVRRRAALRRLSGGRHG